MVAFDEALLPRGFRRVDQATADAETDSPVVVYCLDLADYARDYPALAQGDLQIDTADFVVEYVDDQLRVLLEGDDLWDLAERFDVVVGPEQRGADLEGAIEVAVLQLDRLLDATYRAD
ncbi:MAG TPA: hypothetical protein VFJ14_09455 [Nocardioidaceae bacterium]|nr:hypothetical protein [Nocardioidaceae bacterium]